MKKVSAKITSLVLLSTFLVLFGCSQQDEQEMFEKIEDKVEKTKIHSNKAETKEPN
jgi:D-Tyr-tRNAtyr deacylase